jgi:acetylornithine deacetylase
VLKAAEAEQLFPEAMSKGEKPIIGKKSSNTSDRLRGIRERAAMIARRLLSPLRGETIGLLRELVATNSVAIPPQGNETPAQKVLYRFLQRHRVDTEIYDTGFLRHCKHAAVRRERQYVGRCNLIARLSGSGNGRSLLLTGHIDTVPPGHTPWKDSPWSAAVRKGRVYGLGSYDMKGGLAANCAVIAALKKANFRLRGDLLCESVVDEEWGGGGGTLAGRLRGDNADACVIAEPTNLAIYRASRGGYVFDLIAQAGDTQGYFSKEEVVSPAVAMGRLLGWIDDWAQKRRHVHKGEPYAQFSDPAPVQVLAVEANRFDPDVPLSVPVRAQAYASTFSFCLTRTCPL